MAAYPISEYLGEDTYRLTERFKAKIVRYQWLYLAGALMMILFFVGGALINWEDDKGLSIMAVSMSVLFIVAAFYDRQYFNPLNRPWLDMIFKLEENGLVLITHGEEEKRYDWNELSAIQHFPVSGHCLIFATKEKVFVGQLFGRVLDATDPLAKAIRDAVRRHGKGDLLASMENRELRNVRGLIEIPVYRLYIYAQTPALSVFFIGILMWMFDGATTGFYICMVCGVLSIPVMTFLTLKYIQRTTTAVAFFQKQLDEDRAGSTSLTDEK